MVAAKHGNIIPYDSDYVAEAFGATEPVDLADYEEWIKVFKSRRDAEIWLEQ